MSTTESAVATAFGTMLEATPGLTEPIRWPNQAATAVVPRYDVSGLRTRNRSADIDGGTESTIYLTVTAVIKAGTFSGDARQMAQRVADRFAAGTFVGEARVAMRPTIDDGFAAGGEYRVPVTIYMRAFID